MAGGQYDKALGYRHTAAQLPIPPAALRRSAFEFDRKQFECHAPLQHGAFTQAFVRARVRADAVVLRADVVLLCIQLPRGPHV